MANKDARELPVLLWRVRNHIMRPVRQSRVQAEAKIRQQLDWEECDESSEMFQRVAEAIDSELTHEVNGQRVTAAEADTFDTSTDADEASVGESGDEYESSFIDDESEEEPADDAFSVTVEENSSDSDVESDSENESCASDACCGGDDDLCDYMPHHEVQNDEQNMLSVVPDQTEETWPVCQVAGGEDFLPGMNNPVVDDSVFVIDPGSSMGQASDVDVSLSDVVFQMLMPNVDECSAVECVTDDETERVSKRARTTDGDL